MVVSLNCLFYSYFTDEHETIVALSQAIQTCEGVLTNLKKGAIKGVFVNHDCYGDALAFCCCMIVIWRRWYDYIADDHLGILQLV